MDNLYEAVEDLLSVVDRVEAGSIKMRERVLRAEGLLLRLCGRRWEELSDRRAEEIGLVVQKMIEEGGLR